MDFFMTRGQHPDRMGIARYGPEHLTALGLCVLFSAAAAAVYGRLSPRRRTVMARALAWSTVALEAGKDLFLLCRGAFGPDYLPLHLCSLSMLVLLADAARPTGLTGDLLYSLTLPGAAAGVLFPNWLDLPVWTFLSLHSFLFHAILLAYPVMRLAAGTLRPNWRNLPRCFGLLLAAAAPIYWLNRRHNLNYLFLNGASPGSPLVALYALLGRQGYLLGLMGLVLLVWGLLYLPWMAARRG
ncbi:MAG: YwaF family protein [Clostridiales bacterium]|nr:YwaF family protein [Clostridiales bacterium]